MNGRIKSGAVVASALLAWSVASSCKPSSNSSGSELKALDSFAANTKIRVNQCRRAADAADTSRAFNEAKYGADLLLKDRIVVEVADPVRRQELRNEVLIALTAVPDFSQRILAKMDGFIRIAPNAAKLCGAFLSDES